ncbi:metallophosphoesterase [Erythrobacter sp. HA6-11]
MLFKGMRLSLARWLALAVLAMILLLLKAAHDTLSTPIVRKIEVSLSIHEEATRKPLTIALLADIHVAGPDMPPSRLERIVAQTNALDPDLILVAGDLVSDKRTATYHYPTQEAVAPLAALSSPYGVIVVPGNHDHWRDMPAIAKELDGHGITLLENEATKRAGITIVGLDDDFTGRADIGIVDEAFVAPTGQLIVLSHSPDPFPDLPDGFGLMLAGHTHCGQIAWPWGGSPATMSKHGQRYACGVTQEKGNTLITSSGIGTSVLPFRLFTRPEIWLIEVK